MSRYSDTLTDELTGAPIPGAKVGVYDQAGAVAVLTDDGGNDLLNPLTTDTFGGYYFNTAAGFYDLDFRVGGRRLFIDRGVPVGSAYDAELAAERAEAAEAVTLVAEANALNASTSAQSASNQAGLYAAAALAANKGLFDTAAAGVSNGVIGTASLVGGSGGTNGTFALGFSGGGGSNAAGQFVVAGGIVTQVTITAPGTGYTSAPTLSFSASTGLAGASATSLIAPRNGVGEYYLVKGSGNTYASLYKNVAGTGTAQGLDLASAAALASVIASVALLMGYNYQTVNGQASLAPGSAVGALTIRIDETATASGSIDSIEFTPPNSGTVKVFSLRPDDTILGTSVLTATAGSLNSFDAATINLAVAAGGKIAFYTATGSLGSAGGGSVSYVSGEYAGGGGWSVATNFDLHVRISLRDGGRQVVTADAQIHAAETAKALATTPFVNLFDKAKITPNSLVRTGRNGNIPAGEVIAFAGYFVTDFMPVEGGATYSVWNAKDADVNAGYGLVWCDAKKLALADTSTNPGFPINNGDSFTAPASARWARLGMANTIASGSLAALSVPTNIIADGMMFVPGTTKPPGYLPFGDSGRVVFAKPSAGLDVGYWGDSLLSIFNQQFQTALGKRTGLNLKRQDARPGRMVSGALEAYGVNAPTASLGSIGTYLNSRAMTSAYAAGGVISDFNHFGDVPADGTTLAQCLAPLEKLVICLGTNDANFWPVGAPGDSYTAGTQWGNWTWFLDALQTAAPALDFIGLTNAYISNGGTTPAQAKAAAATTEAAFKSRGMKVVNFYERSGINAVTLSTLTLDGLHWTADVADRAASLVAELM